MRGVRFAERNANRPTLTAVSAVPGLPANCVEVLWNPLNRLVKTRKSEAPAEPPNAGPRCERLPTFLRSRSNRCSARGRDAAQQELRPPGTASCQKVNAIGLPAAVPVELHTDCWRGQVHAGQQPSVRQGQITSCHHAPHGASPNPAPEDPESCPETAGQTSQPPIPRHFRAGRRFPSDWQAADRPPEVARHCFPCTMHTAAAVPVVCRNTRARRCRPDRPIPTPPLSPAGSFDPASALPGGH